MTDGSASAPPPLPAALTAAIVDCLLSLGHLADGLDAGHPPATATHAQAIAHYGEPTPEFHRWAAWSAVARLDVAWRAVQAPIAGSRPAATAADSGAPATQAALR